MSFDVERIYGLLPAIYRIRDEQQGFPLKSYLSVIAEQVTVLEEDLDQLYDDQFIETCADWTVPYIGGLIGYRSLYGDIAEVSSPRAEVANTIRFRRRKGTASMLEELARNLTDWKARVVEFFERLATTQYLNHLRPENLAVPDLRRVGRLEYLHTPFEQAAHTLDVRRIASGRGRYNVPNVGIFLWRLQAYRVTRGTARKVKDGCYTFHPLGFDAPLFNPGRPEDSITHLADPVNVPEPLRRRPLYAELEALRAGLLAGQAAADLVAQNFYFGPEQEQVLKVFRNNALVLLQNLHLCDLSDWALPPATEPEAVHVDPVLGRITFPTGALAVDAVIEVDYSHGFSADMGGGQYPRPNLAAGNATVPTEQPDLPAALSLPAAQGDFVIAIANSATMADAVTITLNKKQRLTIQAKDGTRPVLMGAITINTAEDAEVTFDGLIIAQPVTVNGTASMKLALRDCTLAPWLEPAADGSPEVPVTPSIRWQPDGAGTLVLERTIAGRLLLPENSRVDVRDSIVDALGDDAIALAASADGKTPAGRLNVARTTVIGQVHVREIPLAENSLFTGLLTGERRQQGCVRFCYVPPDSRVPGRYYCQPDLAIQQALKEATAKNPALSLAEQTKLAETIASRLRPVFTARRYGQPAYAQLHATCPEAIRAGAHDGSEMGAFHQLYQLRRATNLRTRLDEYLRFGLEAGIFYAT